MNAAIVAAGLALGIVLMFVGRRQGRVERVRAPAGQPRPAVPAPAVQEPAPPQTDVLVLSVEPSAVPAPAPRRAAASPGRLGVPGEDSEFVLHRPPAPEEFSDRKVLVAGASDVAVEAALSLLSRGNEVALVCRGRDFVGLKPNNDVAVRAAAAAGRITVHFSSEVRRFEAGEVVLGFDGPAGRGELRLPVDLSFVLGA